ncbi:MAG TPA: hypothetical protein VLE93_00350 [Candidatus Saccharimonadales bacterium]|nr:hypothetical protein [Candidatus Saccharimonadales bacterium]
MRRRIFQLILGLFCLLLIEQPLLALPAFAAITPASNQTDASQITAADNPDTAVTKIFDDWNSLDWVTDAVTPPQPAATTGTTAADAKAPKIPAHLKGVLTLSADDQTQLNNCIDPAKQSDCKVDVRLTDYLLNLIAPVDQGGAGLSISAKIFQGYDTNGIGKYDRQTLAANLADPSQISPHNSGQAVDITAAGSITCKLVEHRLIGGHTTKWQPALSVKIAWQSPSGINNNPVPTGDSLIGVAGTMSASGIINYLNSTGQMDAYIDYAKGLDFGTLAQYVGANILLKDLGSVQIQGDPLAGTVIGAIGTSALLKQLPGLPTGINGQVGGDDIRIDAAKAQIEEGLGLPAGSLARPGWDNILVNTGQRLLEEDLGLPTNYLNTHDLKSLNASDIAKAASSYVGRSDDSFNFIAGTVSKLQKNDTAGLKMAAVNVLTKAFKLSDAQTKALTSAIGKNQTPNLDPTGLNTGGQLSVAGLTGLLSNNPADQKTAETELKNIGVTLFQKAVIGAVPSQFSGLTQQLINSLTNPNSTLSLTDLTNNLGLHSLFAAAGADPTQVATYLANPKTAGSTQVAALAASGLNSLFSLNAGTALSGADIASMLTGNFDSLKKIGGGEIDRAMNWTPGTGLNVINDPSKLETALQQTFANGLAQLLGITGSNFSVSGSTSNDYGLALILQRFGLNGFSGNTSAATLLAQIGQNQFKDLFGLTNLNPNNWADGALNQIWSEQDVNLGLPTGTIKSYLQGALNGSGLIKTVGDTNLGQVTLDQIWSQFNLTGDYIPDAGNAGNQKTDLTSLLNYLKTGQGAGQALQLVTKITGHSIDAGANFAVDDFTKYIAAKNDKDRTGALLDAGLKLFGRAIGGALPGYTDTQINNLMTQVKGLFNTGLDALNPTNPAFVVQGLPLINFFVQATGVPKEFTQDAETFLTGDYRTGLSALAFSQWQKNINPYLPADGQLTYQELRDTLGISDPIAVQKEADLLLNPSGNPSSIKPDPATLDMARQELNKQAGQTVQYKISDSFLRKIDPTIPAGFTKAMFTGSDQERAQVLQVFAFNNLDTLLKKINPAYVPGSLEKLYNGTIDPSQVVLTLLGTKDSASALSAAIARSGVTLGPLSSADVGNLVSYFALPKANQNILTDNQFVSAWSNLDGWLSHSLNIGPLPAGIGKSLFYASQNGWNFDASLKNPAGVTIIPSVNSLATNFAAAKLTGWADSALHLPPGSVYQLYTSGKAVIAASEALAGAHTAANVAALSKAQAGLTLLAITTALQVCATCQQFFSSVDAAIHAPPGFTNAAVAGAIASALGLGPTGLYIAAAIYLFGVNSTSYECPQPPVDQFAIPSFDQGGDALSYGYTPGVDGPAPPSPNPAPGQNPFDWDNNVPFVNANAQVWEGWARYFTGQLLDATLSYGGGVPDLNKPLQVLTYRQANVEYFAPRAAEGFGSAEANNPRVGMGYTQASTKTTDYVYVSFGGYF